MPHTIAYDIPEAMRERYTERLHHITKETDRLAMFSADQKIEHLNAVDPHKLFYIAQHGHMGAFATHLGLIHRYAPMYEAINYIVKMDGKSNLRGTSLSDPYSHALWSLEHVCHTRDTTNATICGIGYTVYLGSAYEAYMLQEAATLTYQAHQEGLASIIWMYPRGQAVPDEQDPDIITGATAAATSINADFVKVKTPHGTPDISAQHLHNATRAAGDTRVICSGGARRDAATFLYELATQLHIGKTAGCAVGRNIFTRDREDAIAMTKAIADIVYNDASYGTAYTHLTESSEEDA